MTDISSGKHRLRQAVDAAQKQHFLPPPKLTVSEWADRARYLSPESSALPGKWDTKQVEPARGVMDAVSDTDVHTVTIMACTQLLKTETLNNTVGYHIDQDPSPILVVQPSEEPMARAWSQDRLEPMLRDTPALSDRMGKRKGSGPDNRTLHKKFPGGHITVVGANSAAGLSSRPIRIVLADEVDKYEVSAQREGDPIALAAKRQETYWNAKLILACSPTLKGHSRIEASFERSDQRQYFVACPHCSIAQLLRWDQVQWPEDRPELAAYTCPHCGTLWSESDRIHAIRERGEWRQTAAFKCCGERQEEPEMWGDPDNSGCRRALCRWCWQRAPFRGHAGFHLNRLYSPWVTVGGFAEEYVEACSRGQEDLKVWVNTGLAESWEPPAEQEVEEQELMSRREVYPAEVPDGVAVLTAAIDHHPDRLEMEIIGWGWDEESWAIAHYVFIGDPDEAAVWEQTDAVRRKVWECADGRRLVIDATCVDIGGSHTESAYRYCVDRAGQNVWPIKGGTKRSGKRDPIFPRNPARGAKGQTPVYNVDVNSAKDIVFPRLLKTEPGPGYCHFPSHYEAEFLRQLNAEKPVSERVQGVWIRTWKPRPSRRNEAFDLRVYNYAALCALQNGGLKINEHAARVGATRPQDRAAVHAQGVAVSEQPRVPETPVAETRPPNQASKPGRRVRARSAP